MKQGSGKGTERLDTEPGVTEHRRNNYQYQQLMAIMTVLLLLLLLSFNFVFFLCVHFYVHSFTKSVLFYYHEDEMTRILNQQGSHTERGIKSTCVPIF